VIIIATAITVIITTITITITITINSITITQARTAWRHQVNPVASVSSTMWLLQLCTRWS
jgi:hypothetical protein